MRWSVNLKVIEFCIGTFLLVYKSLNILIMLSGRLTSHLSQDYVFEP